MNRQERQLEEYYALLKQIFQKRRMGDGELRFERASVRASDIAQQYFCEKKVEMEYLYGEVETEQKTLGTEAHEKLLEDSVKVERGDLWREIYGTKPVFALETPLLAHYKNLILAGQPDSVLFQRGVPLCVFEYKFSRSSRPFMDHHVQARTYGILLRNMGFNTEHLFYAIVLASPKVKNDTELKTRVVDVILQNGLKEAVWETSNARVFVHKFDQNEAEQNLDWAIAFWKKQRDAIPTRNSNKCRSCEYSGDCDACVQFEL